MDIRSAFRFFLANSGYCTPPGRAACALAAARAEQAARRIGMEFEWQDDRDFDDSWMTQEEKQRDHTWETCAALLNGQCYASLCGIVDADDDYRRVVESELAQEALGHINEESETAYA